MQRKIIVLLLLLLTLNGFGQSNGASRQTRLFNDHWKFFKGDLPDAAQPAFDDRGWREVELPHDWSVEGPFDARWASATAYLPTGTGWYRKQFTLPQADRSKKISLYFEGVSKNSEVWINGHLLGLRPNGYISFSYDLTPYLRFDGPNVVAVKADHRQFADSRWYAGSGIYRNVFLVTTQPLHFRQWGIYATTPILTNKQAAVAVEATLINENNTDQLISVQSTLKDETGKVVAFSGQMLSVAPALEKRINLTIKVARPHRWSVDHPYLYTLSTCIFQGKKVVDQYDLKIGIRDFHFDANSGFILNGVPMKLKGVCLHHDAGCLGAAVPEDIWKQRLLRLKEMGCNAIRMSHNPHATELYDLCDRLGFLVMDEAFDEWEGGKNKWVAGWNVGTPSRDGYHEVFAQWHERDLRDQLLKNRNHPSIILWSIGNEIDYPNDPYSHPILDVGTNPQIFGRGYHPELPSSNRLGEVARELAAIVKQVDPTRPVTAALAAALISNETGFADALDVVGYNYQEYRYPGDHRNYPHRIVLGSENGYAMEAWNAVLRNPFIAGQFLWTGIEYLGEAGRFPAKHSTSGLLDLAGLPKPEYYFRQSLWSNRPMVYIGTAPVPRNEKEGSLWSQKRADPTWNWASGEQVRVSCFTNCRSVELFLNGVSQGVRQRAPAEQTGVIYWDLPFQPGVLKAVAKDGQGKEHICTLKSAGTPARLLVTVNRRQLSVAQRTVARVELTVTDDQGNPVFEAQPEIRCTLKGPAQLLGLENANPRDTTAYIANQRKAYKGRLVAYLRAGSTPGAVTVTFGSPGLPDAKLILQAR